MVYCSHRKHRNDEDKFGSKFDDGQAVPVALVGELGLKETKEDAYVDWREVGLNKSFRSPISITNLVAISNSLR